MTLRARLILFAAVMLLLFLGLAVGTFLSLTSASREAEEARRELGRLTMLEDLERHCVAGGEPAACAKARAALAELVAARWGPEERNLLDEVIRLSRCLDPGAASADVAALRRAVSGLKERVLERAREGLRAAGAPVHRRAFRLLYAALGLAVTGSLAFAWFYRRLTRERRALEQRVRRSEKLAALGTLAAGISHELNNPLATISVGAEAISERLPRDSEEFRYTQDIQEEAERCRRIIGDLSDLARGSTLDREPVDAAEAVAEAVRILGRDARRAGAVVTGETEDGLPLLSADRGKLLQVLVNLLQNAVDASPPGSPVRLAARRRGRRVEFAVSDRGRGIPEGLRERIFEPFFTDKPTGVGLGLSLCHRIAELHGGELVAESDGPGRGAVFRLVLPAEDADGE